MITTPKSLRLQIGIFGKTNVGKSSVVNMIANQDVSMTSPLAGTTTDVVEKSMELLPIGPVTILDTAGLDDTSDLSALRIERTMRIIDRAEIVLLVTEPKGFNQFDYDVINLLKEKKLPFVVVINKTDLSQPSAEFLKELNELDYDYVSVSSLDLKNRDKYISSLKLKIIAKLPDAYMNPPPLLGDLIPRGGLCVFIIPIDKEAPKGRLILPQVQAIRDILDNDAMSLVVKETEYPAALKMLRKEPDLIVCDSQVVDFMMAETPEHLKATTFSILFSRNKGDLTEEARGAAYIDKLKPGDKVLIAEACSHHPNEDDIGRMKIPRWLRNYLKFDIDISVASGRDFPKDLNEYKLIIHCGGCMLTRNEKLVRIMKAKEAGVAITNYGIAISAIQGVLQRSLSPFPEALAAYRGAADLRSNP